MNMAATTSASVVCPFVRFKKLRSVIAVFFSDPERL